MNYFVLGGGSNILVADRGIRGAVIDTRRFNDFRIKGNRVFAGGGLAISDAAWAAGSAGLAGLDFLFGMPGSVGGALWMNARCYDSEIADVLEEATIIDENGRVQQVAFNSNEWRYKVSPFQTSRQVILEAVFRLEKASPELLRHAMLEKRNDREQKGHYRAPCAGSAFKNNRAFGAPSGVIIDQCGLKGFSVGGAAVSSWHANIPVNTGAAKAQDMKRLLEKITEEVQRQKALQLEPELLSFGDWD